MDVRSFLADFVQRRRDPLQYFRTLSQRSEPLIQLQRWPRKILFANHPDVLVHVHVAKAGQYAKGIGFADLRPVIGNGMILSNGPIWKNSRLAAQPSFHRDRLDGLAVGMKKSVREAVDSWVHGTWISLEAEMIRITLKVISEAFLGADLSASSPQVGAALGRILGTANARSLSPKFLRLPVGAPTPGLWRFRRDGRLLRQTVRTHIAHFRSLSEPPPCLLRSLLEAGLPDLQLEDEILTFFLAGHETTAAVLTWCLVYLSRDPARLAKVRQEIQTGESRGYLRQVIQEVMRLHPPVWLTGREALLDDQILGMRVPAGSVVLSSAYVSHRTHPGWRDPEAFKPERFDSCDSDPAAQDRYAYFPFGLGPRTCMGNHFAMLEMTLVLEEILLRFEVDVVQAEVRPVVSMTLRPGGSVVAALRNYPATAGSISSYLHNSGTGSPAEARPHTSVSTSHHHR